MTPELFKYLLCGFYVLVIYALSWIGMRRTKDIKGFAIGNRDMSPYLIGVTLAASISSTATFVINPGFVYVHGVSAYLHFGIAASLGILTAFCMLTKGFLRLGNQKQALTIPDWIFHRYQHRGLALFFAFINLLSITFVVLILVGCSILMTGLFPIDQKTALVVILVFVFSYVLMGGTYAHAYTNTFQGIMMLLIALFLVVEGWHYVDERGFLGQLQAISPGFSQIFNAESDLYYSFFSVFVSGFVVTFALMLQPHILTKVLYLKTERDIGKFIGTTVVVGFLFSLLLVVGFYARFAGVDVADQDVVVREYLLFNFGSSRFGQYLLAFVFVTLLAAGMSTLDGILVSLSAMVTQDIVQPLVGAKGNGLVWSRWVLVFVGVFGCVLAWNPPAMIGLFAQKGVYGLAAASAVPILFGVLLPQRLPVFLMFSAAIIALSLHLFLNLFFGVTNPAVSATLAIFASLGYAVAGLMLIRFKNHVFYSKRV